MAVTEQVPPGMEPLSWPDAQDRLAAAWKARAILVQRGGPFGAEPSPVDVVEVVRLAEWILTGTLPPPPAGEAGTEAGQ